MCLDRIVHHSLFSILSKSAGEAEVIFHCMARLAASSPLGSHSTASQQI